MKSWLNRFKNPTYVITFIGLFLSSTHITPDTLTSWTALKDALWSVFGNPYLLGCFILAAAGQYMNPTTKGVRD